MGYLFHLNSVLTNINLYFIITFTKNNILFTVVDVFGNVFLNNTSGICGFIHAKKKNFIAQDFTCLLTCRKLLVLFSHHY